MNLFKNTIYLIILILMFNACKDTINKLDNLERGNKYYNKNEHEKAEKRYSKSLDKDSTYFKAHLNKSHSLYKQNKLDKAIKSYKNSLVLAESDNDSAMIYYNLGNALLKKGADSLRTTEEKLKRLEEFLKVLQDQDDIARDTVQIKLQKEKIEAIQDSLDKYQKSIKESIISYKESLLINPEHIDSKLAIAIAQSFIDKNEKEQENQEEQENQKEQENQTEEEKKSDEEIKQNLSKYLNDISDANLNKDTAVIIDNDDW